MNGAQLLASLQLADSFFPTGMFTQSHGLEGFVAAGVAGESQLAPLIESYLLHVAGPGEALAARWVVRAAGQADLELVAQVDQRLDATKLASEPRLASRRCGGRILQLGAELHPGSCLPEYARRVRAGQAPGHQAVALALLAAASGLDEEAAALIELHTFAVSLAGAAVRLGALDHIAAQRILLHAAPVMLEGALLGRERGWRSIGGFAPQIELMQIQHQHALEHMFVS
jgi:urease accessory protein